jgi:5-methylcytosine-specific restriction endonuclease McrA
MAQTVPQATRTSVLERSKFRCERCGTRQMQGLHMSHRQARGMGGSKTKGRPHHRLSNVNALCAKCHLRFVERYPTLAIAEGWKVKTGMDPSTIPILMHDGWWLCLDTGVRVQVAS